MTKKYVVLYVEGETDEEFYKQILSSIKSTLPNRKFAVDKIEIKNIKGITKYDVKITKKFKNEVISKYSNYEKYVFLCYDNDVFEHNPNPPMDRQKLEKKLYQAGANKVFHLVAIHNIEDWIMLDKKGVLDFLKLPSNTKMKSDTGLKQLQTLFSLVNKTYAKGYKVEKLISSLDIESIRRKLANELSPLYNELSGNRQNLSSR